MAEPLKHLYTESLIESLADALADHRPDLDRAAFKAAVFAPPWDDLELKERMARITEVLGRFLPADYGAALAVLKPTAERFEGFEHMYFPGFVEANGLDHFEASVEAMEHFTPFASSEFAVRPFVKRYGERMMTVMQDWTRSSNHHVRRLASEGCRPRLPWAMALPAFQRDPAPVLPILEALRRDESEYVRRSVANNLNDISKDHADLVAELAARWLADGDENTPKLVKHACRTLLKQGRSDVMTLFGFTAPEHLRVVDLKVDGSVPMGGEASFGFRLQSTAGAVGKVRIEYGVDFLRKNGSRSRKVFKISEVEVDGTERPVERRHSFRPISTRTYYPGSQGLAILINGREMARADFELVEA